MAGSTVRDHDWFVYSAAFFLSDRVLVVECRRTGDRGYVRDPSPSEWKRAFHGPIKPYPWPDGGRVTIYAGTASPFDERIKGGA